MCSACSLLHVCVVHVRVVVRIVFTAVCACGVSVQALYVQGVYLSEGAFLVYMPLSLPVVLQPPPLAAPPHTYTPLILCSSSQ
jgi:hypothetical protein